MARRQPNDIFVATVSDKVGLVFDSECKVILAKHICLWNHHVPVDKLWKAVEVPFAVRLDNVRPHPLDLLGSKITVENGLGFIKQMYQAVLYPPSKPP